MRRLSLSATGIICASLLAFSACGDSEDPSAGDFSVEEGEGDETRYGDDSTVVVDPNEEQETIVTGDPDSCVDVGGECIDLEEEKNQADDPHCENPDAQADIIVEDGEVVDVICYPPKEDGTDIENVSDADGDIPQTENGTVVTFDEDTNGEPIEDDITVDSERTTLYGNGIDKTIIDGDITVKSNESRVRSMTIYGDVSYETNANNSALAFCKIRGNLSVEANNFTGTNCQIFGDVTVSGTGAQLVNLGVHGEWNVHQSAYCEGCYSFTDENEDWEVQESEIGETLTCDDADGGGSGGTTGGSDVGGTTDGSGVTGGY